MVLVLSQRIGPDLCRAHSLVLFIVVFLLFVSFFLQKIKFNLINKKSLKLLQWNSRSAVANKTSLLIFLDNYDVDVALLSETWFKPSVPIAFPGYNIVRKDRIDGKAGVAILVAKKYKYSEIHFRDNFNTNTLVCGIKLHGKPNIDILSIYRPWDFTSPEDWIKIFDYCSPPLIIGGGLQCTQFFMG